MRLLSYLLLFALLSSTITSLSATEKEATPTKCQQWNRRLVQVENQLRAGYRTGEGNRLKERRRQLQSKLRNRCHQQPAGSRGSHSGA